MNLAILAGSASQFLMQARRRPHRVIPEAGCAMETLETRRLFAVFYVSPLGSDSASGLSPQQPLASIQAAVNKAKTLAIAATSPRDNNTIYVASGVYGYNDSLAGDSKSLGFPAVVGVIDQQLTIVGGFNTQFNAFAGQSIIDGGYSVRGVAVVSSIRHTGVTLNNFIVRDCVGGPSSIQSTLTAYGAGMIIDMGADPTANPTDTIENVTFQNNTVRGASSTGAAVNSGAGGEGAGGGLAALFGRDVDLENDVFDSNFAKGGAGPVRGGAGLGGGIYGEDGTQFRGARLVFRYNQSIGASSLGAGMTGNITEDGFGGAMAMLTSCGATFTNVTATSNLGQGGDAGSAAGDIAGSGYGGAFYAEESNLSLTDSTLSNNRLIGGSGAKGGTPAGGAIFVYQGVSRGGSVSLNRVSILSNTEVAGAGSLTPGGALGGGVALQDAVAAPLTANITNTVIAGNSITSPGGSPVAVNSGGGAIWNDGATANLAQDTFADNSVQSNMNGEALLIYGGADNLAWDIVANHNAVSVAALAPVSSGTITLTGPVLFSNNSSNGTFANSGNALSAGSAGFVDAANRDYHLLSSSSAKDAGSGSPVTVDRDNLPRIGTPDLGAYESIAPNTFSGSIYGSVYVDVNANGQQDAIDYGLPKQHVWIDLNNDGRYEPGEPAATTDSSGNWFFAGLAPGSYIVRYYTPPGPYFQTAPLSSAGRTVDVETGVSSGINFGVGGGRGSGYATISGNVFADQNGNAFQDIGEVGIAGQHVWIDLNSDGIYEPGEPAVATDANGNFQFTGIEPGAYTVRYYVPAGFRQTTAGGQGFTLSLSPGADASGVTFGVAQAN